MPRVTQKLIVKIGDVCLNSPVYLSWLGLNGGRNYWLFDRDNETKTKTRASTSYTPNIADLETAVATHDITGKIIAPTLEVGARVSKNDMIGIRSLYESSKVLMLSNPLTWETDGPKWKRVIVKSGSLIVLRTNSEFLSVRLTFDIPRKNSQQE